MKTGQQLEVVLNYSSLYKLNPETARAAMLEVFQQTANISKTARLFKTSRKVVQLAIKKDGSGNLNDLSHARKTVVHKTTGLVEEKIIIKKPCPRRFTNIPKDTTCPCISGQQNVLIPGLDFWLTHIKNHSLMV